MTSAPRGARMLPALLLGVAVTACSRGAPVGAGDPQLRESWNAYVRRFIQADGRVIDYRGGQISTSEGQAYAMLRAVWMGDRRTFDKALSWSRNNLQSGVRPDHLWSWKWGKAPDGSWRVLDAAFACDADQDAALALLLASKSWGEVPYLADARRTLASLWQEGTVLVGGRRFLLGGDRLCGGGSCRLNPSYYAPYAYRIFARHDPDHDWSQLVETSYFLLDANSGLTTTGLPSDWILFDRGTGALSLGSEKDSLYSYDAFRAHWRVAMDEALFGEPRARRFLTRSLGWLADRWRHEHKLPALISARGEPRADYESLEMLAGVMSALQIVAPDIAAEMSRRLESKYAQGVWGEPDTYYLQNWAWFGTALYRRHLGPFELVR